MPTTMQTRLQARSYYDASSSATESSIDDVAKRLTIEMVFHTGFGDIDVAEQSAGQLVSRGRLLFLIRQRESPCCDLLPHSYRRTGSYSRARELCHESLAIAKRLRISQGAFTAIELLGFICLDMGRLQRGSCIPESAAREIDAAHRKRTCARWSLSSKLDLRSKPTIRQPLRWPRCPCGCKPAAEAKATTTSPFDLTGCRQPCTERGPVKIDSVSPSSRSPFLSRSAWVPGLSSRGSGSRTSKHGPTGSRESDPQ